MLKTRLKSLPVWALVLAAALFVGAGLIAWQLRTVPLVHDIVVWLWSSYPVLLWPGLAAVLLAAPFLVPFARAVRLRRRRERAAGVLSEAREAMHRASLARAGDEELIRLDEKVRQATEAAQAAGARTAASHSYGRGRPVQDKFKPGAVYVTSAVICSLVWLAATVGFWVMYGAWKGEAILKDNQVTQITDLPQFRAARIVPFDVLDRMAQNGFSSTTEQLEHGHMIVSDGKLLFTHELAPSGFLRLRSKPAAGVATQDPMSTERTLRTVKVKGGFAVAPSLKGWFFKPGEWDRSLRVKAYRRHYLTSIKEYTAVVTTSGEVLFVAPYYTFKGLLVRRPVLTGVFVAHQDGKLEDLTLAQARKRPDLIASGRLLAEDYVRKIHENLRYRRGAVNGRFGRQEVYELGDAGEGNGQPYLTVLATGRPAWVSVLQPKGKSGATGAVAITDAQTGVTSLWRPKAGQFITGAQRALEAVRERPLDGITWANGNYEAVEPRPLFLSGKLHFLISVIPANRAGLTKSVIFDAHRNKVIAVFDHDAPADDRRLAEYIAAGRSEVRLGGGGEEPSQPAPDGQTDTVPVTPGKPAVKGSPRERVQRLLERNAADRAELEALLAELSRR